MQIKKLLKSLEQLAGLAQETGSKKTADAVRTLSSVIEDSDTDRPVEQSLHDLRELLSTEKRRFFERHVSQLNDAGTDDQLFKSTLEKLERDKSLAKSDIDAIAHMYTNGRTSWPSKKAALKAIRKTFVERAYQEGKMKIVEDYKLGSR